GVPVCERPSPVSRWSQSPGIVGRRSNENAPVIIGMAAASVATLGNARAAYQVADFRWESLSSSGEGPRSRGARAARAGRHVRRGAGGPHITGLDDVPPPGGAASAIG